MFSVKNVFFVFWVLAFAVAPASFVAAENDALSLGAPPNFDGVRHGSGRAALETDNKGVLLSNGFYVGPKANAPERKPVSATEMMKKRGMVPGGGGAWYHPDTQGNSEGLSLGGPPTNDVRHGSGRAALETDNKGVLLSNGFYVGPKANAPERKPVSATEMMKKRGMLPAGGGAWYHPDTQGNSEGLSLGGPPTNDVRHGGGRALLESQTVGGISGANVMPANTKRQNYGEAVNITLIDTDLYARDFDGSTNLYGNTNGVKFFSENPGMRISVHQPVLSSAQMSGIKILDESGGVVYQSQRSESNSAYFIFTETGKPGEIGSPDFISQSPSETVQRSQQAYVNNYPDVKGLGQSNLRPFILKTNTNYIFAPYAQEWRENKPTDWFRSRIRVDSKGVRPAVARVNTNNSATKENADMGALEPLTEPFKFFLKQPRNQQLANRIAANPQLIAYMVRNELSQTQVQSFSATLDDVLKQAKIKDVSTPQSAAVTTQPTAPAAQPASGSSCRTLDGQTVEHGWEGTLHSSPSVSCLQTCDAALMRNPVQCQNGKFQRCRNTYVNVGGQLQLKYQCEDFEIAYGGNQSQPPCFGPVPPSGCPVVGDTPPTRVKNNAFAACSINECRSCKLPDGRNIQHDGSFDVYANPIGCGGCKVLGQAVCSDGRPKGMNPGVGTRSISCRPSNSCTWKSVGDEIIRITMLHLGATKSCPTHPQPPTGGACTSHNDKCYIRDFERNVAPASATLAAFQCTE